MFLQRTSLWYSQLEHESYFHNCDKRHETFPATLDGFEAPRRTEWARPPRVLTSMPDSSCHHSEISLLVSAPLSWRRFLVRELKQEETVNRGQNLLLTRNHAVETTKDLKNGTKSSWGHPEFVCSTFAVSPKTSSRSLIELSKAFGTSRTESRSVEPLCGCPACIVTCLSSPFPFQVSL